MATLDELVMAYISEGGKFPATFQRGYCDAGRFGTNGEGVGISKETSEDYRKGVEQAQKDRLNWTDPTKNMEQIVPVS